VDVKSTTQETTSNLVNSSKNFIKVLTEQLIVTYCALSESVSNKSQVAASNAERDEKDRVRIKELEGLISTLYSVVSTEVANQLGNLRESVANALTGRGESWDGINEQYERFSQQADQLFEFNSGFFSIVTLYTQTFAVFKAKSALLPSLCHSTLSILEEVSAFNSVMKKHSEKVTAFAGDKDRLKKFLDSIARGLGWFIGMTSYKLIKVKDEKE